MLIGVTRRNVREVNHVYRRKSRYDVSRLFIVVKDQ